MVSPKLLTIQKIEIIRRNKTKFWKSTETIEEIAPNSPKITASPHTKIPRKNK
jgi:hypothetical protein